jgi:PAS domain S-box-containing protein
VSSLTVWNTAHNAGPFVRESITDSLLSSQLFLATAALTSLVLAAVTAERTSADEALRANEERLRSVVQSMAEGLVVRDARGVITDCNAAAEQIVGVTRDRLRGRRPEDVVGAAVDIDDRPVSGGRLLGDEALTTGRPEGALTARLTRPDGTHAWVSIASAPVLDAGGRPEGVVSTLSDITQRRAAEQRLVASEQATRALADEQAALRRIATLVASEAPPSSVFEQVTAEVARLLHLPSASVLRYETDGRATVVGSWREAGLTGMPLGASLDLEGDSVVARVYRSGHTERIDNYDDAPGPLAEHLRALGYRSSVAAPLAVGGRLWGVLVASTTRSEGLAADSEGRLCDFADLVAQAVSNADAYDKLAGSRARIVEAGDAERRRLERNLHDGAQQRLVSLALQLRLVEASFDSNPTRARQDLAEAREQLGHALNELRELARGIHPAILTDGGLAPALSALATRAPVPVEINDVPDERLPEPIEAAAYYLIAEAITNVAKHANASHVAVSVLRDDGRVLVHVADDGVGGAEPVGGSGLRGLADRVEALHGQLRVDSPPGGGTRLEARIPVS